MGNTFVKLIIHSKASVCIISVCSTVNICVVKRSNLFCVSRSFPKPKFVNRTAQLSISNASVGVLTSCQGSDGTIEIVGLRGRDKKSTLASANIIAIDPSYSSPSEVSEIYVGEQYVFDSRIKDVGQGNLIVNASRFDVVNVADNEYIATFA